MITWQKKNYFALFIFFNLFSAFMNAHQNQEAAFLLEVEKVLDRSLHSQNDEALFFEIDKEFKNLSDSFQKKYRRLDDILRIVYFMSKCQCEENYDDYNDLRADFLSYQNKTNLTFHEKNILLNNKSLIYSLDHDLNQKNYKNLINSLDFTFIVSVNQPTLIASFLCEEKIKSSSVDDLLCFLEALVHRNHDQKEMMVHGKSLYKAFFDTCLASHKCLGLSDRLSSLLKNEQMLQNQFFFDELKPYCASRLFLNNSLKGGITHIVPAFFRPFSNMLHATEKNEPSINSSPNLNEIAKAIHESRVTTLRYNIEKNQIPVNSLINGKSLLHTAVDDLWELPTIKSFARRKTIIEYLLSKEANPFITAPYLIQGQICRLNPAEVLLAATNYFITHFQDRTLHDRTFFDRAVEIVSILEKICSFEQKVALNEIKKKIHLFSITLAPVYLNEFRYSEQNWRNRADRDGKKDFSYLDTRMADGRSVSILHNAVRVGCLPVIDFLKINNFPMDTQDSLGMNAMHELLNIDQERTSTMVQCFKLLLKYGCPIQEYEDPRFNVVYKIMNRLASTGHIFTNKNIYTIARNNGYDMNNNQPLLRVLRQDRLFLT